MKKTRKKKNKKVAIDDGIIKRIMIKKMIMKMTNLMAMIVTKVVRVAQRNDPHVMVT